MITSYEYINNNERFIIDDYGIIPYNKIYGMLMEEINEREDNNIILSLKYKYQLTREFYHFEIYFHNNLFYYNKYYLNYDTEEDEDNFHFTKRLIYNIEYEFGFLKHNLLMIPIFKSIKKINHKKYISLIKKTFFNNTHLNIDNINNILAFLI